MRQAQTLGAVFGRRPCDFQPKPVAAVGLIREPAQAEEILARGGADLIVMGRMPMADPHWPFTAAMEPGYAHKWPRQTLRRRLILNMG